MSEYQKNEFATARLVFMGADGFILAKGFELAIEGEVQLGVAAGVIGVFALVAVVSGGLVLCYDFRRPTARALDQVCTWGTYFAVIFTTGPAILEMLFSGKI